MQLTVQELKDKYSPEELIGKQLTIIKKNSTQSWDILKEGMTVYIGEIGSDRIRALTQRGFDNHGARLGRFSAYWDEWDPILNVDVVEAAWLDQEKPKSRTRQIALLMLLCQPKG